MKAPTRTAMDSAKSMWPALGAAIATAPVGASVAVSVRNLRSGASFGHEETRVFAAASTIKMVILVALAQAVDDGRLGLSDPSAVLTTQKVGGSGVLDWLQTGLELTLRDHAWLMIAISDNTASNVLIDAVGRPASHDVQRSLGLTATSLNRRFLGRLPDQGAPENVATAADLTILLADIAGGTAASPERCAWMLDLLAGQQHTNRLPRHLPEGVTFAGKSGSLDKIAHDAGLLRGPGGEAAVAVLTQGFDDPYAVDAYIGGIGSAMIKDLRLG